MGPLVTYDLEHAVATIAMDDGKVNVLSPTMFAELGRALDQAEQDGAVVVLTGREGVLSAGFDLKVLRAGGPEAIGMLEAGFELSHRLLSFPTPVVVACPGHAIAMGLFVLLSGDHRIGVTGEVTLVANEVAIGLTMPLAAIEILRQRLTPAAFNRAVTIAATFSPEAALTAGILDEVVAPAELAAAAQAVATSFVALDMAAHAQSKLRARQATLDAIRAGIEAEFAPMRG